MSDQSDMDTAELFLLPSAAETERPEPLSSLVRLDVGGLTHPGKVRPNNEDHYLVFRSSRTLKTLLTNLADRHVPDRFDEVGYALVVADGMGGMAAGEVASSMALSVVVNLSLHSPQWIMRIGDEEAREMMRRIRQRVRQVGAIVARKGRADPALAGMGTTLTATYSIGADLFLCHVGDSRAYLFHDGRLHRLTNDHTLAQALADAGRIPAEQVSTHRLRHVLTRALGLQGGDVEPEVQHLHVNDGDRLLLCTDGLTEMVADDEIAEVLRRVEPSQDACAALVACALDHGGRDNVTVVLARYTIPSPGLLPGE
jgi:protein phosphatase